MAVYSIVEAVFTHAQNQAEQPAIFFEDDVLDYRTLAEKIQRFAQALLQWGLQTGDRVALFLDNCPTFVVAHLGIHLAGGIVVLVNTQYRQVELEHILTDAGVRLCVTTPEGRDALLSLNTPTLETLVLAEVTDDISSPENGVRTLSERLFLALADSTPTSPFKMPDASAPAVLGYTSGTTGRAKGALLLHRHLVSNSIAVTSAWHWTERDRLLLTLPLFHTHGLMVGMHGTLLTGACAVLKRKFVAADVLATLESDPRITLFFGVPTMYTRLLAEAEQHGVPSHLPRLFVSGSAPLSPHVFAQFQHVFGQTILERYGMTETTMNLTNPYAGERRPGTVGGPFPGQEARVVDRESRRVLFHDEIGEIEVRGPHVFSGYWQRPEATAEAFSADGWFRTGDLGWYSSDGYYTITGRARELIISGGFNIYPIEVESVLETHPDIAEVAVTGAPDNDLGEQVVAVIVPVAGHTPVPAEIIAFCRERLASYKKPRRILFVEALPRNALGKVQKHLLPLN